MAVPEIVRDRLGDEEIRARVALGGDDEIVVTPTRSLLYRADGLLSGESVEEHAHNAELIAVDGGRRKSTVHLDHGLDGESAFSLPSRKLDEALPPLLEGVLSVGGITAPDETVEDVYRLGELTIVITTGRVIKHVGDAVWDEEFEEFAFDDVTGLDVEEGEVSSQIIVEVNGRPERIKTPSEDARRIRERIEGQLLSFHDVRNYEEFRGLVVPDDEEDDAAGTEDSDETPASESTDTDGERDAKDGTSQDDGPELVFGTDAPDTVGVEETDGATDPSGDVVEGVAALREVVERQNELLENQQRTIEQLIEELRQGR